MPGLGTKIPHAMEQLSPRTITTDPEHHSKSGSRNKRSCTGHGSNLEVHQQMNGLESCGTYTQWSIIQPLKRIHLNQF